MDEAEKYKQRMEAIAEKRRQLEEQDRARREMEDEKLRLQQLKRKSLRDQWLMEGAPLSPASPDPEVPRSPLWGSHNENQRWPSETQQLAGEEEKLKEQVADGQTEAVKSAEDEVVQDAVVQNGDSNAVGAETEEHEVKTSQCPIPDEAACVLTNGNVEEEEEEDAQPHVSGDSSEQNTQANRNGPLRASENAAGAEMEAGSGLDVSEEGLGHIPNNSSNVEEEEEEEEGTLVMRAECVIITDEGDDDATEEPPHGEGEPRTEEDPRTIPEAAEEGVDDVEEMVKADVAVEALQESGECVAAEAMVEDGSPKGDATEHIDEITDKVEEAPVLQQSSTDALEGAPVAPVPVYSESQPGARGLEPEAAAAAEAPAAPEEPEAAALKAEGPPPADSGQFQDVPLVADPRENHHRTEEQPLLSQAKATADAQAEAEAPASSAETRSANTQETPKQKSCQCCTVM